MEFYTDTQIRQQYYLNLKLSEGKPWKSAKLEKHWKTYLKFKEEAYKRNLSFVKQNSQTSI